MAKAVMIKREDYEVQLTLNREEAEALRAILNRVGGHPSTTRRGLIDGISNTLYMAGVVFRDRDIVRGASINFEDKDEQR